MYCTMWNTFCLTRLYIYIYIYLHLLFVFIFYSPLPFFLFLSLLFFPNYSRAPRVATEGKYAVIHLQRLHYICCIFPHKRDNMTLDFVHLPLLPSPSRRCILFEFNFVLLLHALQRVLNSIASRLSEAWRGNCWPLIFQRGARYYFQTELFIPTPSGGGGGDRDNRISFHDPPPSATQHHQLRISFHDSSTYIFIYARILEFQVLPF